MSASRVMQSYTVIICKGQVIRLHKKITCLFYYIFAIQTNFVTKNMISRLSFFIVGLYL